MYKIAIVEDEKDLASIVSKYLTSDGFNCTIFHTGEDALKEIKNDFHLWILDIMLPGSINGYDLIKKIKENNPNVPVIFSSARDQDIDKIMGLELGSDDYIAKPYSVRELVLRVKNIIFRVYNSNADKISSNTLDYEDYIIDIDKRIVTLNNEMINLTSKEYDLLLFLLENKGKAFSRDQILDSVWGNDYYGSDRVVDDLMRRLRQKMPKMNVETIYGYGYRLL